MEFPHIGEQCSEPTCRQLDFLPFKCTFCKNVYCLEHHKVASHLCTEAKNASVTVPVCPLCNKVVSAPRGTDPDVAVSQHIDNNCYIKKKEKLFTKKCIVDKCPNKEMVKMICGDCKQNVCIAHRLLESHNCAKLRPRKDQPLPTFGPYMNTFASAAQNKVAGYLNTGAYANLSNEEFLAIQGTLSEEQAIEIAILNSQMKEIELSRIEGDDSGKPPNVVKAIEKCVIS